MPQQVTCARRMQDIVQYSNDAFKLLEDTIWYDKYVKGVRCDGIWLRVPLAHAR